eukprot:scaffold1119_cov120-Cylindrotheca_fusiformis.AAC.8
MSAVEEDEASILNSVDQTSRPPDVAIQQQRIKAWHPILDPEWMIYGYLILGVILIPTGYKLESLSDATVEITSIYDAKDKTKIDPNQADNCRIGEEYNANLNCTLEFVAPEDMEPPIMVYYELDNFHQNHRFYSRSKDDFQLYGYVSGRDPNYVKQCEPLEKLGNMTLNPCGLVANTFFNDKFDLIGGADEDGDPLIMNEHGIAWKSDLEYRYKLPEGFQMQACPNCTEATRATCCQDFGFSCKEPHKKGNVCYAYDYPEAETTQYLYQTYPNLISPLEHVTNEHFVVWMRLATRPRFRKLYGWIDKKIPKGETITFRVNLNYVVESFSGHKALILTTTNMFGGKHDILGETFKGLGFIFLACGIFFALKHWFRPRKIADRKYLHYKLD